MQKVKVFSLSLLTLFLVFFSFVIFPVKVFAALRTADEWFNHISQFEFGLAKCEVLGRGSITIVEEPGHEFDGDLIQYGASHYENMLYFEPGLAVLASLIRDGSTIIGYLEEHYEDFDGHFYWNFEEKYWQVEYYNTSDFDNNNNDNNNKEVDMVTDLLDTLGEIGAGIGDLFGRIVESVGQFFYTPGTGDTPGSFTIVGILTIAAVVVSLSMWVLRLILRLFKLRG